MIRRKILDVIDKHRKKYPILALTGPRQSGKTTLLKNAFPNFRYVSLEKPDVRNYATQDPNGFLAEYNEHVIFDEVQRTPALFSYLQDKVDSEDMMGRYILSGSQSFNLIENITQSLAGRVTIFNLFPFDIAELKKAKRLPEDKAELMTKGCYPAVYARDIDPDIYFSDYINTYLLRDISQLQNVRDKRAFIRFLKISADRAGHITNFSNMAKDVGVSHTTIHNWISLLETSFVIFFLKPYFRNYSKRLVKSPKLYFYDTGLLSHLLGIRKGDLDPTHSKWGHLFENLAVSEYEKQNHHNRLLRDYYYWLDSNQHEVDLLYSDGRALHTHEIKSSSTVTSKLIKGLNYFENVSKDKVASKNLIYGGAKSQKRTHFNITSWKSMGM